MKKALTEYVKEQQKLGKTLEEIVALVQKDYHEFGIHNPKLLVESIINS